MKKSKKKNKFEPGTFDLKVKRSRAGLGLFTLGPIKKGECIIEYTGKRLSKKEEETVENQYLFDVGNKKYQTIDGSPRWNTARYINHSCRPNCEIEIRLGRVYVFSKRTIKPKMQIICSFINEGLAPRFADNIYCGFLDTWNNYRLGSY